jgi:hypothetical protein
VHVPLGRNAVRGGGRAADHRRSEDVTAWPSISGKRRSKSLLTQSIVFAQEPGHLRWVPIPRGHGQACGEFSEYL